MIFVLAGSLLTSLLLSDGDTSEYIKNPDEVTDDSWEEEPPVNPINWDKLCEKNSDVYAWIRVPGTSINYAVAQANENLENDFYLRHSIQKTYSFAGMIYTRKNNAKDFSEPLTVMYGHNMRNGSMFGTLRRFEENSFFEKYKKLMCIQKKKCWFIRYMTMVKWVIWI